jgi:hypothetical protein
MKERSSDVAENLYQQAMRSTDKAEVMRLLRKALTIDPMHTNANRLLSKLEGRVPEDIRKSPAGLRSAGRTPKIDNLKPVRSEGSGFNTILILGGLVVALSIGYLLLSQNPEFQRSLTRLFSPPPVTTIDGTPVADVPGAVLRINPHATQTIDYDQRLGCTPENNCFFEAGIVHEYTFSVTEGQSLLVGIWFNAGSASRIEDYTALLDGNNRLTTDRCQPTLNDTGSVIRFDCAVDQTGQWKVRILGIEGESTEGYWVTVES